MNVELVPLLALERDLYALPRGPERFRRYVETVTGGTDKSGGDDVGLPPLVAMNPMAREHVAARIDELLALGAEDVAAAACREARARLAGVEGAFKLGLAVLDDVGGGWTNRFLIEAGALLLHDKQARESWSGPRWAARREWVTVALWASERYDRETVRRETLAAIYRAAHARRFGLPSALEEMLRQEGRALLFAGMEESQLDSEELAYTRAVLSPLLASKHFPTVFAGLFGDGIARSVGFAPLGLSPRAGFALALAEARAARIEPQEALRSLGRGQ